MTEQVKKFLTPDTLAEIKLDANMETEARTLMGYASVFGVLDSQGDIMMPGAFQKTIAERFDKIRVLWQHDWDKPIGLPTVLREDAKGLYFEAEVAKTAQGDKALEEIKAGLVTGVSVGFFIRRYSTFEDDDLRATLDGWARYAQLRRIEEVKLLEFSPVTFAANEDAQIVAVKSILGWSPARASLVLDGAKALALPCPEPSPSSPPSTPAQGQEELHARLAVEAKGILDWLELRRAEDLAATILNSLNA